MKFLYQKIVCDRRKATSGDKIMSKGKGQASQSGPQLSTVICGVPENAAVAKLNLNCPIGIYLSYALQALKVELDKKKKELNDQMNMIVPVIPPDTPEDNLEDVTNTAKEDAAREKEKMIELSEKLQEIADKMGASTAYNAELLDEGNSPLQCQEVG